MEKYGITDICNDDLMLSNLFIKNKYYREPDKDYDIVSVTLFQLEISYKNNDSYYNGLSALVDNFKKLFPSNTFLRLYIDETVLKPNFKTDKTNSYIKYKWIPLITKIKNISYVQIIEYDYLLFKHKYSSVEFGHEGLFGTLLRFEPLFNLSENSKIRNVLILDIDLKLQHYEKRVQGYNTFLKSDNKFYFKCDSSSYLNLRFYCLKDITNTWLRITASTIGCKIKLPCQLYTDFLKTISNKLNNKIYPNTKLMNIYSSYLDRFTAQIVENEKSVSYDSIAKYGIDELLMTVILDYIIQENIKFSYAYYPSFARTLWNYNNRFIKKQVSTKNMEYVLSSIMKDRYQKHKSIHTNYNVIDKIFYEQQHNIGNQETPETKIFKEYATNFIILAETLLKSNTYKNYGLDKDELEAILRIPYISPDFKKIYKESDDRIFYTFKLI
ncbi:MAG: putative orfan [Gaeavirus sp.]|uniref:Putative orfan n=1 Tax=Gaeavirus sp. TaxID=2487767 RepID=A0A3G4ZYW0_9VIRU|nr:MAG: putative orfan [Gaeavirus sp.]